MNFALFLGLLFRLSFAATTTSALSSSCSGLPSFPSTSHVELISCDFIAGKCLLQCEDGFILSKTTDEEQQLIAKCSSNSNEWSIINGECISASDDVDLVSNLKRDGNPNPTPTYKSCGPAPSVPNSKNTCPVIQQTFGSCDSYTCDSGYQKYSSVNASTIYKYLYSSTYYFTLLYPVTGFYTGFQFTDENFSFLQNCGGASTPTTVLGYCSEEYVEIYIGSSNNAIFISASDPALSAKFNTAGINDIQQENISEMQYIINMTSFYESQLGFSWMDIQTAIWTLLNNQVTIQLGYSPENVAYILADANLNGQNYQPFSPTDLTVLFIVPVDGNGARNAQIQLMPVLFSYFSQCADDIVSTCTNGQWSTTGSCVPHFNPPFNHSYNPTPSQSHSMSFKICGSPPSIENSTNDCTSVRSSSGSCNAYTCDSGYHNITRINSTIISNYLAEEEFQFTLFVPENFPIGITVTNVDFSISQNCANAISQIPNVLLGYCTEDDINIGIDITYNGIAISSSDLYLTSKLVSRGIRDVNETALSQVEYIINMTSYYENVLGFSWADTQAAIWKLLNANIAGPITEIGYSLVDVDYILDDARLNGLDYKPVNPNDLSVLIIIPVDNSGYRVAQTLLIPVNYSVFSQCADEIASTCVGGEWITTGGCQPPFNPPYVPPAYPNCGLAPNVTNGISNCSYSNSSSGFCDSYICDAGYQPFYTVTESPPQLSVISEYLNDGVVTFIPTFPVVGAYMGYQFTNSNFSLLGNCGGSVTATYFQGFCSEYAIRITNGLPCNASMYSVYDPDLVLIFAAFGITDVNMTAFNQMQYIVNMTSYYINVDGFSSNDVQGALWQLLDNLPENDEVGYIIYNQTNVNLILADAAKNGIHYYPSQPNDLTIIFLVPVGSKGTISNERSNQMQIIPVALSVFTQCQPINATCSEGSWTTEGYCVPSTCSGLPNLPSHATNVNCQNGGQKVGSSCNLSCNAGFVGGYTATCLSNSKWITFGNCTKTCSALPILPTNTNNFTGSCQSGMITGTICPLSCNAGFSGQPSLTCLGGTWKTTGTACSQIYCPGLPILPKNSSNNNCGSGSQKAKTTCTLKCNSGYSGTPSATCSIAGSWSTSGSCAPIYCSGLPPLPANSANSNCGNGTQRAGTSCNLACKTGFKGTLSATCSATGAWTTSGTCTKSP